MIEDDYLELIHGEVDGENSPEQSRRLWEYLQDNPEAMGLLEEMKSLSLELVRMESVPVPPNFKDGVMMQLRGRDQRPGTGKSPPGSRGHRLRPYVYATAAGLLLGVFLASWYWSLDQGAPQTSLVRGTVVDPRFDYAERLSRVEIDGDGVSGAAEVLRADQGIQLRLSLESEGSARVLVKYSPADLLFSGLHLSEGDVDELIVEQSLVSFVHQGKHSYWLLFEGLGSEAAPLEISILIGDQTVFHSTLPGSLEAR